MPTAQSTVNLLNDVTIRPLAEADEPRGASLLASWLGHLPGYQRAYRSLSGNDLKWAMHDAFSGRLNVARRYGGLNLAAYNNDGEILAMGTVFPTSTEPALVEEYQRIFEDLELTYGSVFVDNVLETITAQARHAKHVNGGKPTDYDIVMLGTHPEARGRGLAGQIIAGLLDWIKAQKVERPIKVELETAYEKNVRVFAKSGFKVTSHTVLFAGEELEIPTYSMMLEL